LFIYKTNHEISSKNYSSIKKNNEYTYGCNKNITVKKDPLHFLIDIYNQSEIGNLSKPGHFYLLSADTSEMILPPTGSDARCSLIALQDKSKVQRPVPVMKFMSETAFPDLRYTFETELF